MFWTASDPSIELWRAALGLTEFLARRILKVYADLLNAVALLLYPVAGMWVEQEHFSQAHPVPIGWVSFFWGASDWSA